MRGRVASVLFVFVSLFVATIFGVHVSGCSSDDGAPIAPPDAGVTIVPIDAGPPPDTRPAYKLTGAKATRATRVQVTFAEPPNPVEAAVLANYSIAGLTLTGTPALTGNVVTLETSAQAEQVYTVTIANVTRASDAKPLERGTVTFTGRKPFDVVSAAAKTSITVAVTFDDAPDPASATTLANYSVAGLTLDGTPTLDDKTVTLTVKETMSVAPYTVTVANVVRMADGEPLEKSTADFNGTDTFNVLGAVSGGNTSLLVTFDGPPKPSQAIDVANYTVPGLVLIGPGTLGGHTATFKTEPQLQQKYTVTVANVTRTTDGQILTGKTADFNGRTSFNVVSAQSTRTNKVVVTFDANPGFQASVAANYAIPGLTVQSVQLSGKVATLTTSNQAAQDYDVTVGTNVVRQSDSEALKTNKATFTGREPFTITNVTALDNVSMSVTFSHAPNAAFATALGSYDVPTLTLKGTPALATNTVTLDTAVQVAKTYTLTVGGVVRESDGEPLLVASMDFSGIPMQTPTVTNVIVVSTNPDNGTTPYNTGTITVQIVGTDFSTALCPNNVKLDDLNSIGGVVGTVASSCTVNSNSMITATFPRGIRTNGSTGWNVRVKNDVGTNALSAVKLVPVAGLVISEVLLATGNGPSLEHEFVEIYNRTNTALDVGPAGLDLHLHFRDVSANSTEKTLVSAWAAGTMPAIASHGFLMIASAESAAESYWSVRDMTYTATTAPSLAANTGVYISLSATAYAKVLDKVGWGTQAVDGYEGTQATNAPNGQSIQRKPAGGAGHDVDTDDNSADFLAPAAPTPRGLSSAPQP